MTRLCIVEFKVEFCNSSCPHFYHRFDDQENCYCSKLNKKVYDYGYDPIGYEDTFYDHVNRPFPKECPLKEI